MGYDGAWSYPEYVPVARKKANNEQLAAKLALTNNNLKPLRIQGRKIVNTFWGKAWCDNVEAYQDYANRLPRGRSYVRNNAVLDLQISPGLVTALVAGSSGETYEVHIEIAPLKKARWDALKQKCVGQVSSLLALAQGQLPPEILSEFCNRDSGLFPSLQEIKTDCSCLDWASLCKHLAAVLYGVGARLDEEPGLFFILRGIDAHELVGTDIINALTEGVAEEIASDSLAEIFGVEFDCLEDILPEETNAKVQETNGSNQASRERKLPPMQESVKELTPECIVNFRLELKLTQEKLARLIGVSAMTVSNWERGKTSPQKVQQHRLANIINRNRKISTKEASN